MSWDPKLDFASNFSNYPKKKGNSYPHHVLEVSFFGMLAVLYAVMLFIHAFCPFWLQRDGIDGINKLSKLLEKFQKEYEEAQI